MEERRDNALPYSRAAPRGVTMRYHSNPAKAAYAAGRSLRPVTQRHFVSSSPASTSCSFLSTQSWVSGLRMLLEG